MIKMDIEGLIIVRRMKLLCVLLLFLNFIQAQNENHCLKLLEQPKKYAEPVFRIPSKDSARIVNKIVYLKMRVSTNKRIHPKRDAVTYYGMRASWDLIFPFYTNPDPLPWGRNGYDFMAYDKDLILNYLLCNFQGKDKEDIIYSYSDGRDSIFKNMIDFTKHEVNAYSYYYDLRRTDVSYIVLCIRQYEHCLEYLEQLFLLMKAYKTLDEDMILLPKEGKNIPYIWSVRIFIPIINENTVF